MGEHSTGDHCNNNDQLVRRSEGQERVDSRRGRRIGSAALRTRGDVVEGWGWGEEVACSDAVSRPGVAYAARCGTNRGNVGLYRRSAVRPNLATSTLAHPFQLTRQRRFIARLPTSAHYSTSRTRLNTI